jgi:phosphoribosylformylglycinamidine synthase
LPQTGLSLAAATHVHAAVADAIRRGLIAACHDCSDGGWLTAAAEMAIAGLRGANLPLGAAGPDPFAELCAGYLVETPEPDAVQALAADAGATVVQLGDVRSDEQFVIAGHAMPVATLRAAWNGQSEKT